MAMSKSQVKPVAHFSTSTGLTVFSTTMQARAA